MFKSLKRAKQAAKQVASGNNNDAYSKLKSLVTGDAVQMRTPSKIEARATVAAAKQLKELNKISATLSSNAPVMREFLGKDEKQLEQEIDERVERLAAEMPSQYFNKVFFDARVENQVLKEALDIHAKSLDLPLESVVKQAKKAQVSQDLYNELIRDHLRKEQAALAEEARAQLAKDDEYAKAVGDLAANIKDSISAEDYRNYTTWMFPEDLEEMAKFELFESLVYQLPPDDKRKLNMEQMLDLSKQKLQVLKQAKQSQDAFSAKLAEISKLSGQELAARSYDDISSYVNKQQVQDELLPALKSQLAVDEQQAKQTFLQALEQASAQYHKDMVVQSVPYEIFNGLEDHIAQTITFEAFSANVQRALQMEILRQQYGVLQLAEKNKISEDQVDVQMQQAADELNALYKERVQPNLHKLYETLYKQKKHSADVYEEATQRLTQAQMGQLNLATRLLGVWFQSALALEHYASTTEQAQQQQQQYSSASVADLGKNGEKLQHSFANPTPRTEHEALSKYMDDNETRVYADPLILKMAGFTVGPRLPYVRTNDDAMKPWVKFYAEYFSKDRNAPVPDLAVDPYVSVRPAMERVIDVRQEYARKFYGIKTGRRYASFLSVNGFRREHFVNQAYEHIVQRRNVDGLLDRLNEQSDYQGDLQWALLSRASAFDRTDKLQANNYRHRTIRELEKRKSRSEKRRRLVQRLDNTLRAFAWVRNYYKSFLSK